MDIALLNSATELSLTLPKGSIIVPDLEDLLAIAITSKRQFSGRYKIPEDLFPTEDALRKALGKRMRQSERVMIDELTIFTLETIPACKDHAAFLYCTGNAREWAFGFRYRTDVDWWLVIRAGKHLEPFFVNLPITLLLHTTELNHWRAASQFFSEMVWTYAVQTKASKEPLPAGGQVFPFLERMLKTDHLVPLYQALKNVNFYQVNTDEDGNAELPENFSVAINNSRTAWNEAETMITNLYPAYFMAGGTKYAAEVWENFKKDGRAVLLLARSFYQQDDVEDSEPMILGFLAGGMHPVSDKPCIMAMAVLPDERRRGIGTALVRRFFAHTAYKEVICSLHMKHGAEPYEEAAFLTSLNGILKGQHICFWCFEIVNPFLK